MGSEWKTAKLTDFYEISSGLSKAAKYFGSGHPFLSFKDVFNNFFLPEELSQLVESSDQEQQKCSIRQGDIFLTRTSETMDELGMSCVALKDYNRATFNGFTKRLRPKNTDSLVPEYVGYYLRSPKFRQEMLAFSTMSTRASLNNEMIGKLSITYPPRGEQEAIGRILKTLDDKITLNHQINTTLESMAQALFKSWFVDFDPVIDKALAAGNPIPEALKARADARAALGDQRKPLPDHIRQQFPDRFVLTEEMGWVPEGWAPSKVGTEFDVTMGQSPPGHTYNDNGEGMPFFQGRADFGFRYPSNRIYCTEPKRLARKGDTLVSVRAPVGDVNMAALDCCIGRGVSASRHKSGSRSFTYYAMLQLSEHFKVYEAEGTVFGSINQKSFNALKQIAIPAPVVKLFEEQAGQFDTRIEITSNETATLIDLRDTLLPKLLSGELRVANAERQLSEVE